MLMYTALNWKTCINEDIRNGLIVKREIVLWNRKFYFEGKTEFKAEAGSKGKLLN